MSILASLRDWLRRRRPLWAIYPTPRCGVLVAVAAPLWLIPGPSGRTLAISGLAIVAAMVAADWVVLPGRFAVSLRREVPMSVGLGDATTQRCVVSSTWTWPTIATLHQELPATIAAGTSDAQLPVRLAPGATVEIEVPLAPRVRGRHHLGAAALRLLTPLGLLARITRFPDPGGELLVVPSLTNVRRFRLLALHHRLSEAGVRALKARGDGRDFVGLREYVPGDDPRLIDWKATARHRRMIAREHAAERSQSVITMIDCGRVMTQMAGAYPRFEHVLSAALVLSDVAAAGGDRVGLLAFDDMVRSFVSPRRGQDAVGSVRAALSGLEATMTEPDYAAAFRLLALRQPRRALVVFFTDVIDARVARSLVAYLERSAARHLVVVVAIRNDALLEAARPRSGGALALFRSAAAEELVREREEALARMRRAGVTVLDVAPTQLAVAVVNRYLEAKARGSI